MLSLNLVGGQLSLSLSVSCTDLTCRSHSRLAKEVDSYVKEASSNEARVQKMKDDGRDEYDIRKAEEVLAESCMMIPDSKSRHEAALTDLKDLIDRNLEHLTEAEGLAEALDLVKDLAT